MVSSAKQPLNLSRWARLKQQQAQAQSPKEPAIVVRDKENPNEAQNVAEATDSHLHLSAEEYCAQLPAVDSLCAMSDFSVFMDERVFPDLRRRALRMLFKQPQFNIRDGLDDYDDDYTFFEKLGSVETCDMKFAKAQEELKNATSELMDEVDHEVSKIERQQPEQQELQEPKPDDVLIEPPEETDGLSGRLSAESTISHV